MNLHWTENPQVCYNAASGDGYCVTECLLGRKHKKQKLFDIYFLRTIQQIRSVFFDSTFYIKPTSFIHNNSNIENNTYVSNLLQLFLKFYLQIAIIFIVSKAIQMRIPFRIKQGYSWRYSVIICRQAWNITRYSPEKNLHINLSASEDGLKIVF